MFVTNLTWNSFSLKTVKRMLYLGYVLLRYVLIYNLEVSFEFYLTFLQLKAGLKCSLCSKNRSFPYSRLFFSSPISRTFFDFPWRFELLGVDFIIHTVVFDFLAYWTHVFFQGVEQASLFIIIKMGGGYSLIWPIRECTRIQIKNIVCMYVPLDRVWFLTSLS